MVRKIIKSRLDDGQFNECDLTIKELDQIARTLNETLLGIFHSRIEYPADVQVTRADPKARKDKDKAADENKADENKKKRWTHEFEIIV